MEPESHGKSRRTIKPRLPTERSVLTALRDLMRAYTRHHEDLDIDHALMSGNFPISVRANDDDQGKLVGGGGSNIWALQFIFKVIGLRMGKRLKVTLLSPTKGKQGELTPFAPKPDFNHGPIADLLERILGMMISQPMRLNVADIAEETQFEIVPADEDLPLFRGDGTHAFQNLVTAIGKSQGRKMVFNLAAPVALAAPVRNGLTGALDSSLTDLPPQAPQVSAPLPEDAIEAEARERGYIK
jgi:predicted RNA-binding protein YlqC (UPF0109 family)